MASGFDDFVAGLQHAVGRYALVEVMRTEDGYVVAELRGRIGEIVLCADYAHDQRGVGWVPVGEQPLADRGPGFPIDAARCQGSDVSDVVMRGYFDELAYIVTPGPAPQSR